MTEYHEDNTRYRFAVENDGTITRARLVYRHDSDAWSHYFDGDWAVGFVIYCSMPHGVLPNTSLVDESKRAMRAYLAERDHPDTAKGSDNRSALDRVAVRLGGTHFLYVSVDRDIDCYVLTSTSDTPEGREQDEAFIAEIEAVAVGECYEIEASTFDPDTGEWSTPDFDSSYYGEDAAVDAFFNEYPLDAFPAERVLREGA